MALTTTAVCKATPALRVEAGLRQEQLAARPGVSQGYGSRIEGRNDLPLN